MTNARRAKRKRLRFHRRAGHAAPPGMLAVDPSAARPKLTLVAFSQDHFEERQVDDPATLTPTVEGAAVMWLNVEGLGDADTIRAIGRIFHLHPLALEDVVNVHQRTKAEQYGDHMFIVARMLDTRRPLTTEQVSLFVGKNYVITFTEDPGDSFDAVRQRLRGGGTIRSHGAGYLTYALLDAVVDAYFPLLEDLGERMDALEDHVALRPTRENIASIHAMKHELRSLRRIMWPLRETLHVLSREVSTLFDNETRVYLRDCHDHTVQILDLVETYRELGADMTDLYLSTLSNRLNEVMKVLTIIATIFMPLSFIVGVYGMNFDTSVSPWNMPELKWPYGYVMVWCVNLAVAGGMVAWFARRGWIGARDDTRVAESGEGRGERG